MLFEIFRFELIYRAKRADTYVYFMALFLFSIIAVDFIYEGALDTVYRNAPVVIAKTMGIVSALFMMVTSMIMGVAALRDFDHHMESIMFVNPINKRDYLLGRFLGSFVILCIIFCALPLGMILGDLMPWVDPERLGVFNISHYLSPFIILILPTLFFGGAIFFVSGALSRKLMIVYTQGILFLLLYLISLQFVSNSNALKAVSILEPFTFQSVGIITKYWTVIEQNILSIPYDGVLLYNRLIWIGIGGIALWIGYIRFDFSVIKNKKYKKNRIETSTPITEIQLQKSIILPKIEQQFNVKSSLKLLIKHSLFYFKSVLKEVPFWAMVICSAGILLISSIQLGTAFGVDSYPTTYIIIGELIENTLIFFFLIILFYAADLIWKERDQKLHYIYDALPVSDSIHLLSKFIGHTLVYIALMIVMILSGIVFQISRGYYDFELDVYFTGLFIEIFPFFFILSAISFFIQAMVNHKFISHIIIMIVLIVVIVPLKITGTDHGLYTLGGSDIGGYSDMNGYGHFLAPYLWFKAYWLLFVALLFIATIVISSRGTEVQFLMRVQQAKQRFTKSLRIISSTILIFLIGVGSYIFYNTNILNDYSYQSTENKHRAQYEKTLKQFQYLPQPEVVDIQLRLELYPSDRTYNVEGHYILTNKHRKAINEIHIQRLPSNEITYEYVNFEHGATLNTMYEEFGYGIHLLDKPLQPGDSIQMNFKQLFSTQGFTERSGNNIVQNGTFFMNFSFPTIGYNDNIELDDTSARKKLELERKSGRALIDDPNGLISGRANGDGEDILLDMVIGTEIDQTAITSGSLKKEWVENNRRYFHYVSDTPISNFYAMLSARYEVTKDKWEPSIDTSMSPVDLEIYYHKGHEYNLDRMMHGMKKSLDYFTEQFSPYQYEQMRIVEVPNYRKRAQSFPNTVPFSENIGFILDIDDEKDVDMAFYVTSHELAHQWWGHQINPADVQGKAMISESLAQYSSAMVLKKEFPETKVQQFLDFERERYLRQRTNSSDPELPLSLVDAGQDYIHYGKGLINLYTFQEYISEDSVNVALKRFIRDWRSISGLKKSQTDQYPTTTDLLGYFKVVTPDSLQYTITDLFESVTLYDIRMREATFEMEDPQKYTLHMNVEALKYHIDTKGTEQSVDIQDWIDIGVYGEEGTLIYLQKHKIDNTQTHISITLDQKPSKAGIDPRHRLIERDTDDNISEVLIKE